MSKTLLEADTLELGLAKAGDRALARPVTLTIAHHSDPRRVGERVRLTLLDHARSRVPIGRAEPLFRATANVPATPLLSPFVSRKPLWLEGLGDGAVRIDASEAGSRIEVDGRPLTGTFDCDRAALERGVVVQVGSHVVLLLHVETVATDEPYRADGRLIGESEAMLNVRAAIARIAADAGSVLVRGETGSGKELVAAAIHAASARSSRAFVAVNMAAVSTTLAASELFGHVKGAFSGADQTHDGYFVRANGGTLFLDEVGDTPMEVQATLLRTLETGEVMPVGGRAPKAVDVRIVAATDADLDGAIANGRFRAPLFYRLAANEIRLPPLRERRSDIGRLVVHFLMKDLVELGRHALLQPALTLESPWLTAALVARLCRYDWPGNVRQLRSVCHALALASGTPGGLPDAELDRLMPVRDVRREAPTAPLASMVAAVAPVAPDAPVAKVAKVAGEPAVEKPAPGAARTPASITPDELERVLVQFDFRLSVAADHFGISRPSMNELVDRHPRLKRAQKLTAEDIESGRREAGRSGQPLWRVLGVSDRGLKQRMTELGLD